MILTAILSLIWALLKFLVNLLPVIGMPVFLQGSLVPALNMAVAFNNYLPVSELFSVVVFLLGFKLTWKILAIVLNIAHININM